VNVERVSCHALLHTTFARRSAVDLDVLACVTARSLTVLLAETLEKLIGSVVERSRDAALAAASDCVWPVYLQDMQRCVPCSHGGRLLWRGVCPALL
jgi:hypothetical protein